MPGKSRHGKGKHSQLSRKRKDRQHFVAATQPPVTAQTPNITPLAGKVAPRANVPAPSAPVTANYPYIGTELLRIGILTGIILVILFVLALVSPKF